MSDAPLSGHNASYGLLNLDKSTWVIFTVINVTFLIFIVLLNPFMMIAAIYCKHSENSHKAILVSFVCSASVMGFLSLSVNILQLLFPAYIIDNGLCYVLLGLLLFAMGLLLSNIFILSVSNYIYIVHPLKSITLFSERIQIFVLTICLCLTLIGSVSLSISSYIQDTRDRKGFCFLDSLPPLALYIVLYGFILPSGIMIVFFDVRVLQTAKRQAFRIANENSWTNQKSNRKYLSRILIYEYMFFFAYIPTIVVTMIGAHCPTCMSTVVDISIRTFTFGLTGLIPIIFTVSTKNGRQSLWALKQKACCTNAVTSFKP